MASSQAHDRYDRPDPAAIFRFKKARRDDPIVRRGVP
jgi:hypothetical protein